MSLIVLKKVNVGFGDPAVLEKVDLRINAGERLCLIGRNGEGKSTLMRVITGELAIDDGEIQQQQDLTITSLTQEIPENLTGSIYTIVASGLGEQGRLLAQYFRLSGEVNSDRMDKLVELDEVQQQLEHTGGWQIGQKVETVLSRLQLTGKSQFSELSGGLKRRVLLAKALVSEPDVLLLDEPTNHLDIQAILWLEEFLQKFSGTLLFITHDRMLIQNLATRIIELDRGLLTSWPGDYQTYLKRKQETLENEQKESALFDKKLSQEENWIRQGIKARRKRNEGRVRALKEMREKRKARRVRSGKAGLKLNEIELSGKLVAEAERISFNYNSKEIFKDFSTIILRGDKIGIIGPNGCGKSTLLQVLLGRLKPKTGKLKIGTNLNVAYFDQHRNSLDYTKSIIDNIAGGSDKVSINGKDRHVISYLRDFLFSPRRIHTPVKVLSGGERNRLLLAKLFTKPANLLVMDEPTNDLDLETLELLEEKLLEYTGTMILVSHDRSFINNIVTSTIVFENKGMVNEYVGGYDDWLRQRKPIAVVESEQNKEKIKKQKKKARTKLKLSYKELRELDQLPERIENLENEQHRLHVAMASPGYYKCDSDRIIADKKRAEEIERELSQAYARWEYLDTGPSVKQ